jgi:hypothetical protein
MSRIEPIKIKHDLTDEEKQSYGLQLAQSLVVLENLKDEKKAFNDRIKGEITAAEEEIGKLKDALNQGWIYHEFTGTRRKNFAQKVWEYLDPNTGMVISTKPFSPSDYQMSTSDVVKDEEEGLDDGDDADLDALTANIKEDEPKGDFVDFTVPGADYMPAPDFGNYEDDYKKTTGRGRKPKQ